MSQEDTFDAINVANPPGNGGFAINLPGNGDGSVVDAARGLLSIMQAVVENGGLILQMKA